MKYYNQLPQNNSHNSEEEVPDGLSHWVLDVFQAIFWLIAIGCLLLVYSLIPKEEVDGAIESINKTAPQVTARISDTVESTKKSPGAKFGAWYLSKEFKSSASALKAQKPKLQKGTKVVMETVDSSTDIAPPKDDLIAINWTGKDAELDENNRGKKKKDKKDKKKKKPKNSKKDSPNKNTRNN